MNISRQRNSEPARLSMAAFREGSSVTGGNVDIIKDSPMNSNASPITTSPVIFFFCPFAIVNTNPIAISGYVMNLSAPSKPANAIIQVVNEAPMFAPMMTRIACVNASTPALTKLTTVTVAALEDSANVVIQNPERMLLTGFFFIHGRKFFILSPVSFIKPPLRRFSP